MKVYKLKKDWSYVIGNSGVGFIMKYKEGDLFFKPTDESKYKTIGPDYFPQNGSYAVSEREDFKFVDEYFELIEETDKPKEYYIDKVYTQFQVDQMFSKKIPNE